MNALTLDTLIAQDACASQRDLFRGLFGDCVVITPELCVKHAARFDWDWVATHLLTPAARAEYARVCDSAWAEFQRVRDTARAEYDRVCAETFGRLYCAQEVMP